VVDIDADQAAPFIEVPDHSGRHLASVRAGFPGEVDI
jgi:hypothetical protein